MKTKLALFAGAAVLALATAVPASAAPAATPIGYDSQADETRDLNAEALIDARAQNDGDDDDGPGLLMTDTDDDDNEDGLAVMQGDDSDLEDDEDSDAGDDDGGGAD